MKVEMMTTLVAERAQECTERGVLFPHSEGTPDDVFSQVTTSKRALHNLFVGHACLSRMRP